MNLKTGSKLSWLFFINVIISTFTFGGGYVVIPMIRKEFVEKKQCFSEKELLDMAAIAQSSPGAIAVNLSVLAGYRTAGMRGAVVSCVAAVLPSFFILSLISISYDAFRSNVFISAALKGMEAGVAVLIVDLVWDMIGLIWKEKRNLHKILVIFAFVGSFVFQIPVLWILSIGCVAALLEVGLQSRKGAV